MKRLISVLAVSILIISPISAISSHSESQKYSYIVVFKHPSMIDFSLNITNSSKLLKYREYLKNLHDKFINWLEEKTGKTKFKEFFNVLNAVKIRVPSSIVPLIESLPYVRSVYPDIRVQALLADSRSLIRLDYALSIKNLTGEGVTVAVLDTGIDYTHP
ncbi:MAG: protease inhibitor I9 family protein, partial [Thermoplasmata archaeon]|nr:protease inhibitor I9 family protein [Thermoplasmata archaeon]